MAGDADQTRCSRRAAHWVDVLFATSMVALTQGNSSIFFFLLLFAVLVASFSRGTTEGFYVTCVSVMLFQLAGLWFGPDPGHSTWTGPWFGRSTC